MKKNLLKLLAMLMALALVLAFAGCGSSDTAKKDTGEVKEDIEGEDDWSR